MPHRDCERSVQVALEVGVKLGPYELTGVVGAGGMGEVYRARDPRLNRDVAVKVLPSSLSADPQRLRRFEQEARAAAALSHPNILSVYDVGTQNGSPYIVSELLPGETLRAKLRPGPLPVRKAIDYAQQIARGLAAAHEIGIVHRDLKPENIVVTNDGRVKILDFGLAKLTRPEPQGTGDESMRTADTDAASIVGTVGYMSPEQVRGKPADGRSDLFAFGAILYEMLSGQRAFKGDTAADTLTAILTKDPPELTSSQLDVSPALDRIVRHCLEKSPEERFQSARDVAFDLETLSTASSASAKPVPVSGKSHIKLATALLIASVALLAIGMVAGRRTAPRPSVPSYQQLTFRRGTIFTAKFAPDGQIVYSAAWEGNRPQLFTTSTESRGSAATEIRDADVESISHSGELLVIVERHPVFAFVRPGTLARSPLSGAAPRPVLQDVQDADWAPDGTNIAIARYLDQRFRMEYPIGKVLYETDGWVSYPRVSPKGDMVAFLDHPIFGDDRGSVAVVDSAGHKRTLTPEFPSTQALAWTPDGSELWFSAATTGSAADLYGVTLSGKLRTVTRVPGGIRLLDIGRNGRVIMAQGHVRRSAMVLGAGQKAERDLAIADWSINADLKPDGSAALLEEESEGSELYSVYLRKTDGSPPVRLGEGSAEKLSPDGQWALSISLSTPTQLSLLPIGAGQPKQLPHDAGMEIFANSDWMPDSKHVIFSAVERGHKPRVYLQDIDGGQPRPITAEGVSGGIHCAPDSKRIAVKGQHQTWIVPLDGGPLRSVPGLGSDDFVIGWSPDGRSLYVTTASEMPAKLYRSSIETGAREVTKQFAPADTAGVEGVGPIQVTPDLRYYSYGFARYLTDMYAVEGLK
jgi:serine/threonine protein kinase/Tol biopolymer transport system component